MVRVYVEVSEHWIGKLRNCVRCERYMTYSAEEGRDLTGPAGILHLSKNVWIQDEVGNVKIIKYCWQHQPANVTYRGMPDVDMDEFAQVKMCAVNLEWIRIKS